MTDAETPPIRHRKRIPSSDAAFDAGLARRTTLTIEIR